MLKYCFWNNKGGTGKTSLIFQAISFYAQQNPSKKILVIDLCPQANLSELLLGGLQSGGENLFALIYNGRKTIGGYFQERILSPYRISLSPSELRDYLFTVNDKNKNIPSNVDLLAGDPLVELQTNTISEQATAQLPGENAWSRVIDWLNDFLNSLEPQYDTVFIDANPSFSIYTQIAIAAANHLVIPTMADDSSKRAIQNVFSLVYGIDMPNERYKNVAFSEKMKEANKALPKIKLVVKNRLTQYMGPATAYGAVLSQIDRIIGEKLESNSAAFSFCRTGDGVLDVRDFGTTGVISFAKAIPFYLLNATRYQIGTKKVQLRQDYITNCKDSVKRLVSVL